MMNKNSILRFSPILLVLFVLVGCKTPAPTNIGLTTEGTLHACPESPNCVSTLAESEDKKHFIGAIYYETTAEEAKSNVITTVNELKGSKIVTNEDTYIHVEFTTKLMSFVDDVEFLLDDELKTIHFRSASRVGYGDMGANRRRMEKFKEIFYAL